MSLQRYKEVKTRKTHLCGSCGKTIPAGSVVLNASGIAIDDDKKAHPYSYHYCGKCMEAAEIDEGEEAYKEHLDIFG